jgi:sugar transferase (PEP-CTERM system associated)
VQAEAGLLRIFGHFVPLPALALGLCELLLLSALFYFVNAPLAAAQLRLEPLPAQMSLGIAASALVAMVAVGLYHYDVFLDGRLMAIKIGAALLLVVPAAVVLGFVYSHAGAEGIAWAPWSFRASAVWVVAVMATRAVFLRLFDSNLFRRPVLVIGTGVRARRIAELVERGQNHSFAVKAYVHAGGDLRLVMGSRLDLDRCDDDYALSRHVAEAGAREVVVATDERRGMPVAQLLHCRIAGVNVVDYLTFWERETRKVELESLQPSWLIYSDGFRQGLLVDAMKRALDLCVCLVLLVFVLPVLVGAIIAIKLEDRDPVFYRQERVGRGGRPFTLLKLRTMRADAECDGTPQWARNGDPRVTGVGMLLRRFRIDELPQLLNVLDGTMSFVGPRPERPFFVAEIAKNVPFYRERHSVKPGITGWAQVNYPYGASLDDARQKLGYDLYYVKNRTIFLDILIVLQTARVILFPEGVR